MHKIIQFIRRSGALVLVFTLAHFASSYGAGAEWPFVFDGGRLIAKATPEEAAKAKAILEQVDEKHIADNMQGGIIFDGKVVRRLSDDKFGQPSWMMRPSHVILGNDNLSADGIVVVSPKSEDGGVILRDDVKYRIFTVNIDGRFYIWEAVVVELKK